MDSIPEGTSAVTSPERRAFILVLGGMSLLFLAVEGWAPQPGYVLAARLLMSALLLAAPVLLRRPLRARRVAAVVYGVSAGVCLSFGTIAWGTGGTASPYFAFLPMLSLVFTIAVPDVPLGSLAAGLCAGGVGLARVHAERLPAATAAFWTLAFASTTTYAVAGAVMTRRQRARERRLVEERARAEELLAETERQRARAQRLALAGRLAAGIAQDVEGPLSDVTARLLRIERSVAPGAAPELPATFAEVRAALDRIRRTVEDLRTFAREDAEVAERCELPVLVEEARLTAAERYGAAVSVARPAELPAVAAVRARLVQGLAWILVDASGRGIRRVELVARSEGGEVILEVRDAAPDLSRALRDLPAAPLHEPGLALALAREDLASAGCALEASEPPLRLRFKAPDAEPRRAARVA